MSEGAVVPEVVRVGAHEICIEEPDLTAYRLRGLLTVDEVLALTEVERLTWEGRERVYVFIHTENLSLAPRMLLFSTDLYRNAPLRVVAVVGPSFSVRVGMDMLVRTLRLVGKPTSVRSFADEASARAWLREKRKTAGAAG